MKRNVFVKCTALTLAVMMVLQMMPNSLWSVLADPVMPDEIYLSDMDWNVTETIPAGAGSIHKDADCNGQPASVNGVTYLKAIGTHAINDVNQNQDIVYDIGGFGYVYFETLVGIKDPAFPNNVQFSILVDGVVKASYLATGFQSAKKLAVLVKNAQKLTLRVNCTQDGYPCDSSIWAMPLLKKSMPDSLYLSDINWNENETIPAGAGTIHKDATIDGAAINIAGTSYIHAVGTHAINDPAQNQDIVYDIGDYGYEYFETLVGIHQPAFPNKVLFSILVDGVVKASYEATGFQPVKKLFVSIKGAKKLTLRVNCTPDGYPCDNSIWAEPTMKTSFPDSVYLSDMDWNPNETNPAGAGTIHKDATIDGVAINIAGTSYTHAVGTHAINDVNQNQDIVYDIGGLGFVYFETLVGIHTPAFPNLVRFSILVDGVEKASYVATGLQPAKKMAVSIIGAQKLTLRVNCTEDGYPCDNSIWANPVMSKSFPDSIYLSDLCWNTQETIPAGAGSIHKDADCNGDSAVIAGVTYDKAIGTHAINDINQNQDIVYDIEGMGYQYFETMVGIKDQNFDFINHVRFSILVDGVEKTKYIATALEPAKKMSVTVTNAKKITLRINCSSDGYPYDNSIWANPILTKTVPAIEPRSMPDTIDLTDLEWEYAEAGANSVGKNTNVVGNFLRIGSTHYEKGIGTHAFNSDYPADVIYDIAGMGYKYMTVDVGLDEGIGGLGSVQFQILGDGEIIDQSPVLTGTDNPYFMRVKIENVRELTLRVLNADGSYNSDWADWGSPKLYKEISMLPESMAVYCITDGMKIFTDTLTLSGDVSGFSSLNINVDNNSIQTYQTSGFNWQTSISFPAGKHTLRIDCMKNGEVKMSKNYSIERVDFHADKTYRFQSKSTIIEIGKMGGMLAVTSLKNSDSGAEWLSSISEVPLPEKITVDGQDTSVEWAYKTDSTVTKDGVKTTTIQFTCAKYSLALDSVWISYPDTSAPVRHYLNMVNNSGKEITVFSVSSLQLNLTGRSNNTLELQMIDKGAATPDGTGSYLFDIQNGLDKNIFSAAEYNDGSAFESGYIPYAGIQENGNGIYAGLEWPQGRVRVQGGVYSNGQQFILTDGLNADFKTDIPNGESYYIPPAFIGCYTGTRDDGSNEMTKWYFNYMMPKVNQDAKYPALQDSYYWPTARTRGEWISTDKNFFNTVDQLAKLGFTAGVLDIGWNVADGVFDADATRWADGLAKQAQYSHSKGLEFGVYFRPLNGMSNIPGSLSSVAGVGKADWFVSNGGNATLDLGNDEAKAAYKAGLRKLISESGLDVLRTDFGGIIGWSNRINRHKYGVDTTYWTARAFYDVMGDLKEEFPGLRWENCSCGGTLKDFMSMQYASHIQSTDTYTALDVRRTFYDASYVLPAMQIELFFNDFMMSNIVADDFNYRYRSALLGMPDYSIPMDYEMTETDKAKLSRITEIYNEWMKPLVKNANIYHVLPRANGVDWDGMEYMDPNTGKGAVLVFKGTTSENNRNVKLAGLDAAKTYHIWFEDETIPYQKITGQKLMTDGITFHLNGQYKSEIMYIQEVGNSDSGITAPGAFTGKGETSVTADVANTVTISWNAAAGANRYRIAIFEENSTTPAAEKEQTGTSITMDGLKAGSTYHWTITALNQFGETEMTGNYTVQSTGTAYLAKLVNLNVSGSISEKGGITAQEILYLDSLKVKTNDAIFTANEDVTLTADLDPAAGYKTLAGVLALDENKTGESATVTLTTNLGITKTFALQENDPERQFSLDISGASELTIVVKNTSRDVVKQEELLLSRRYDNANPDNEYFKTIADKTSGKYLFSTDICNNVSGIISNTPRYGIYAGYVDKDNYIGVYLDRQYNLLTTTARVGGINQGTLHIPLQTGFDHSKYHNLAAYRDGDTFKLYLDGKLMEIRTAAIPESAVGLAQIDSMATYKNMSLKIDGVDTAFTLNTPVSGIWKGLAPTVVFGKPYLYGQALTVNDPEPAEMPADPKTEIDTSATVTDVPKNGCSKKIAFDGDEDLTQFNIYSSNYSEGYSVNNGKLLSNNNGEQKAILKTPSALANGYAQVDIGMNEAGGMMNGGLYLMAKNAANKQDGISALNIQLESPAGSTALMIGIHKFDSNNGWLGTAAFTSINNYFTDGNTKADVTLKVVFENGLMNVYVDGSLILAMMNISIGNFTSGAVGLRSQFSSLQFDNLQVVDYDNSGWPEEPTDDGDDDDVEPGDDTLKTKTDIFDFSSAAQGDQLSQYSSSNGGFEIANGQLVPTGEAGEFKALLKGIRTYKSIQVDIIPGASGKINSGIYIGASGAGDAIDSVNALGILVQSDFEGWEDAGNRIDLIIGSFPNWTELSRTIIETGAGNALYTNGVKQPLRLRVDIDGDNLTITLSLASDPDKKVVKQYVYNGASKGTVGLRSFFNDSAFDNLNVTYLAETTNNGGTDNNPQTGDAYPILLLLLLGASVTVIRNNRKKKNNGQQAA